MTFTEADFGDELLVILAELKAAMGDYLASRPGDGPRTLADVVAFNRDHADVELAHFGQSLFEQSLTGPDVTSREYVDARARCLRHAREEGIDAALRAHDLDALVTPSYAPACPIDLVNAEAHPGSCTGPAAVAGYPLLTVPTGLAAGLPVAVSFWGTARQRGDAGRGRARLRAGAGRGHRPAAAAGLRTVRLTAARSAGRPRPAAAR